VALSSDLLSGKHRGTNFRRNPLTTNWKLIGALVVGIVLGGGAGIGGALVLADDDDGDKTTEVVADAEATPHGHDTAAGMHKKVEVTNRESAPTVRIEAIPDSKSGINIHIITENFTFTPENVGEAHIEGEGHTHLYVDGKKVARVYGEWYHLDGLSHGEHEIRVTLNANDHADYQLDGKNIEATIKAAPRV